MSGLFKPKIPKPAAAPAPAPQEQPKRLEIAETSGRTAVRNKKRGRSGLRIDLQAGTAGADGTGINVPRA